MIIDQELQVGHIRAKKNTMIKNTKINKILKVNGLKLFKKAIKTGLPITYEENSCIVRLHKGNKTIIKKINKTKLNLPNKFILK